jgi:class 3 adenylate cyclase
VAGGTHTFLFTDLVGFTALAASEGDDRAADVALEFVQCVEPLAATHGAEVVKRLGDGLMLRSPDAGCAVRLGLAIVAEQNDRVPVRVGMHTGPAVERGGDWFGTTVNVAARLCGAAGGGEVLVSEATREGAGRLRKLELGDHRLHWLKNLDEPVGARTVSLPEPRSRFAFTEQALGFLCASPRPMKEAL